MALPPRAPRDTPLRHPPQAAAVPVLAPRHARGRSDPRLALPRLISPGSIAAQLDRYEALLECADADLFDWISGRAAPPAAHDHDVMQLLLTFRCAPPADVSNLGELARSLAERPRARRRCSARPRGMTRRSSAGSSPKGHARRWLHVCRDDGRMARFAAALAFFHPELEVLTFPAWDCLPYDRVSPNGEITQPAHRHADPARRGRAPEAPLVVLTTVNAAGPARAAAAAVRRPRADPAAGRTHRRSTGCRASFATTAISAPTRCASRASSRCAAASSISTRRARRSRCGSISSATRSRALRSFDPLTQRTTGTVDRGDCGRSARCCSTTRRSTASARATASSSAPPAPTIRSTSRSAPGGATSAWSIGCRSITRGSRPCSTTCPAPAVSLDHQADEVRGHRLEAIADFYGARAQCPPPRALAPRSIARSTRAALSRRRGMAARRCAGDAGRPALALRRARDGDRDRFDAGARPARNFAAERADPKVNSVRGGARLSRSRAQGRRACRDRRLQRRLGRPARRPCCASVDVADLRRSPMATRSRALPDRRSGSRSCRSSRASRPTRWSLLGEQDILGDRLARPPRRRAQPRRSSSPRRRASRAGDLVVHAEHGIGRYDGLETIDVAGAPHDCLRVLYAGDDKLFVPVENIEVLSRYGSEEAGAQLDRLGGVAWQSRKARVKQRIRDIAGELIRVAAERQLRAGRGDDAARRASTRNSPRASRIPRPTTSYARSTTRSRDMALGPADGPADLRRCRLRQDRGGAARRLRRGDGRRPGRGGGADDSAGAAALPQLHRALRRAAGAGRAAVAPGSARRRRAQIKEDSPTARSTSSSAPMRCSAKDVRVPASRPADRRRGAAFRRRAEGAAEAAQGRCACADADRDADPAHLAAGAVRRARDEHHRDAAGRPAGGAHLRHALRSGGDPRGDPARARSRRPDLLRRAAHRRSRRGAPSELREMVPEINVAMAHGQMAPTELEDGHDRVRRARLSTCCSRPTSSNRASTSRSPTR